MPVMLERHDQKAEVAAGRPQIKDGRELHFWLRHTAEPTLLTPQDLNSASVYPVVL